MAISTETLQGTTNLCRTHIQLQPLAGVGGFTNEPALSLCNQTLQELMAAPYAWKFNRIEMPMLVTCPFKQDYLFGGATVFSLGSTSHGAAIGLASNNGIVAQGGAGPGPASTVQVTTLEPHRFAVGDVVYLIGAVVKSGSSDISSSYNAIFTNDGKSAQWSQGFTITSVPTPTTFVFAAVTPMSNTDVGGAPGITDFGWAESATRIEMNNTSPIGNIHPVKAVLELQPTWKCFNPEKVCVLKDNGDGTLKIRFEYIPGTICWGINLVYQAKAPLKIALSDNWSPFPDEYGFVYRQMFLACCWRYLNDPRQVIEFQKAENFILKALGKADSESGETHVVPALGLLDW